MRITKESRHVDGIAYRHTFYFPGHVGSWGFSFDCTVDGTVDVLAMWPESVRNYADCLDWSVDVVDSGIEALPFHYREPAEGKCQCGRMVVLYGDAMGDTDCDCGRIYNSSGQELNPRWMWGEETGETFERCPYADD